MVAARSGRAARRPGGAQATGLIRRGAPHECRPPGHKLFTEQEVLRRWWPWDDGADPDGGPGGGGRPGSRLPSVRVHPGDRAGPGGLVGNDLDGVFVEVEGPVAAVSEFLLLLERDAPPLARIERVTTAAIAPRRSASFAIAASEPAAGRVRAAPDPGVGGHRHVRRLPARACRSGRPAVRVPVHQLHQLRAQVHHRPGRALRPAADDHGGVRDVRAVRGRIP